MPDTRIALRWKYLVAVDIDNYIRFGKSYKTIVNPEVIR